MVGLLEERVRAGLGWNLSVSDLRLVLGRPGTMAERNGYVWEDRAGRVVGFGLLWEPYDGVYLLVGPEHDTERAAEPALCRDIVTRLEARGIELARERGKEVTLRARVGEDAAGLMALLEGRGYSREERHTLRYRRSLATPFPEPAPPAGFTLRHVRGEEEVEAYVALHREAFGTDHMTADARLARMRSPGYVAELDLVAAAPDGTLAALVVGEILVEESDAAGYVIGSTDPLGTRPAYRRMGLARALLLEAFRRLREHGAEVTTVGTGSWNEPTQRLLESVGYELEHRRLTYAKGMQPAG